MGVLGMWTLADRRELEGWTVFKARLDGINFAMKREMHRSRWQSYRLLLSTSQPEMIIENETISIRCPRLL